MKRSIKYMGILGLLFVFGSLRGQDEEFKASAPAVVKLGDQFQYVIEGSSRGDVLLPAMEGFQLLAGPFSSFSSHTQWVNGKRTMKTVASYTHVLRATKAGTLSIAPSTVKAGRKQYTTNAVEITVQGSSSAGGGQAATQRAGAASGSGAGTQNERVVADAGDQVFLRVQPSKREVYVGEQFVSGLKVYTRVNTRPASGTSDLPYEGFYKKTVDPDQNAGRQTINGQEYISQVIQRHILIPQKSGDIVIEPYKSEWMIQQQVKRRRSSSAFDSFFDDPFFSGVQEVPSTLATPPVIIKVKPLPEGAPAGFKGAVGDFTMKAELSSGEVEVNESLSLKLSIRGSGNLPLMGEPVVDLPPDHDLYDVSRKLSVSTSGNRLSGSVLFDYPIVARHAGRYRIPPIRFSWFDPKTKTYKSVVSKEFTFVVRKGEGGESGPSVFVPGINQENVEDIGTDIHDIIRSAPMLVPVNNTLMGRFGFRLLFLILPLLALALIILLRVVSRRNADLSLVRNRRASREATNRLKKADRFRKKGADEAFYEEMGKALWGYLGDKLGIDTSRLSRDEVELCLQQRNIAVEEIQKLISLLDDCEFSRFAPSSARCDAESMYRAAVQIIKKLEDRL